MSDEFAGSLRQRITVERQALARDALGLPSGLWVSLGTYWAAVTHAGEGTLAVADAVEALPRYRVAARTGCRAMAGDRIIWRGRILRVLSAITDPITPDRMTFLTEEIR